MQGRFGHGDGETDLRGQLDKIGGVDSFTYQASDGTLQSNPATVSITVNGVNDAPVALADSYTTDEDVVLNVATAGVLGNDTDVEGDILSTVLVGNPANGSLTLNANGSFAYTPNANFFGSDNFTYRANDGVLNSNLVTVSITVNPVNDAPLAVDDAYSVDEDLVLTITAPGVLANDSDVEGDLFTAAAVTAPGNGGLTLNADGSFIYTPNANFAGADSFTYVANDGQGSGNLATVRITVNPVNDAPLAVDDSAVTLQDTPAVINVLANDSDIDGSVDATSVTVASGPANGTTAVNATTGVVTYTPNTGFNGSDSFTYTVRDNGGALSGIATVSLTITAVNGPPVATDDSYSVVEDTLLSVIAPGVLGNDTDPDGDTLTVLVQTAPVSGSLTLNADGSLSYQPNLNFFGSDSFTYLANDGTLDSNLATVSLTVTPVNDVPVAVDDAATTDEDTAVTIDVAANDSDVDGTLDLTRVTIVSNPTRGTLSVNATTGVVRYAPFNNLNGSDQFTYTIADNSGAVSNVATVLLTIRPINDLPVARDDNASTLQGNAVNIAVAANDSDIEGPVDLTSVVIGSGPANGGATINATTGVVTYTPNVGFNGSDQFTYTIADGAGARSNEATVRLTINPLNTPPVAVADAYAVDEDTALNVPASGVLGNDTDVDGDTLTTRLVRTTTRGSLTLNRNGSFRYVPNANIFGTDSFVYRANDGTISGNQVTVTITINPVNDAPVADAGTNQVALFGQVVSLDGTASSDIDGDPLTYAWTMTGSPAGSTAMLLGNTLSVANFTPDIIGVYNFSLVVNDNLLDSAPATIAVAVSLCGSGTKDWVSNANGFWRDGFNWSGGTVPGPADAVCIDVAANITVTHSLGTDVVASLVSSEAVVLSGGSLTVTSSARILNGFTQSGGTFSGTGTLTVSGLFTWSGGTMSGTGITVVNGSALFDGPNSKNLARQLDINPLKLATWSGGHFRLFGTATINNRGTFRVAHAGNLLFVNDRGVGIKEFNNSGLFEKVTPATGTVGVSSFSTPVEFNNTGTVDVQAGNVSVAVYVQITGTTNIDGGTLSTSTGNAIEIQGGNLFGQASGVVGNVTSSAAINPGLSAATGVLDVSGRYIGNVAGSAINIQLGGIAVGSGYDQLNVGGAATLGGDLNVSLVGVFAPPAGSSYTIMTYASATGTFANLNVPAGFTVVVGATSVTLTAP